MPSSALDLREDVATGLDVAMHDVPVTQIYANFVASTNTAILTDTIRSHIKQYLLDYFGVTIAAAYDCESTESIFKGVLALGAVGGHSTVVLNGQKFLPQFAGLLNATLGHSLDFDDTYAPGTLHAGVCAISAALTQTELLGSDVADVDQFMLAVAIGYEVICRLGRELGNAAYERGFHNTGTCGIFGAVAAICSLRRLPESTIMNAFGLALSKASGSMQYLENGSWNKRLHPGFAVHDAFMCVSLAEAGVIGASKPIEGKLGLLHAYSPKGNYNVSALIDDLGVQWTFLETALKPFPACRMTHGMIEMAGIHGEASKGREVDKIIVSLSKENYIVVGSRIPNKLHPKNVVDAQFSAYFQLAHAWLYGSNTGMQCYERLNDEAIHQFTEKIICVEDCSVLKFGCKMDIHYVDGEQKRLDIPYPLGEAEHPFSIEAVEAKYLKLAGPAIGEDRAHGIKALIYNLEKHSVAELLQSVA